MKEKLYILHKATLGELMDLNPDYRGAAVYGWINLRPSSDLTPEEKSVQGAYKYRANRDVSGYVSSETVDNKVNKAIEKLVQEKYRGNFYEKVKEEVRNMNVWFCIRIRPVDGDGDVAPNGKFIDTRFETTTNIKNTAEQLKVEVSDNVAEFEEILKSHKQTPPVGETEGVYIESLIYRWNYFSLRHADRVPGRIRRTVTEQMVYCLKSGKNIVPDEYLDKGMTGIKEWQAAKRGSNKNNSMEKKLMRECLAKKKDSLTTVTKEVMYAVSNGRDWTIPGLHVDGKYNKALVKKLVNTLLKGKTEKEIATMTEEDLVKLAKEYWKEQLRKAIMEIDNKQIVNLTKVEW